MLIVNFLSILFWMVLAAYVVHILDETLMGGGFTQKVKLHWWPEYHIEMFFWFNTAFLMAMILSNALYDAFGQHWIILPLFWTFERATHTLTLHLWWSVRYKEYSPGLLSGILFLVIAYFTIRYGWANRQILPADFTTGLLSGITGGILLSLLPTIIMPFFAKQKKRSGDT